MTERSQGARPPQTTRLWPRDDIDRSPVMDFPAFARIDCWHVRCDLGRTATPASPRRLTGVLFVRHPIRLAIFAVPLLHALLLPPSAAAQFPYPPYYPGYRYAAPESDLKVDVQPKEAAVYVDGYFAGKVDEFDGAFQRLHVSPGEHEITVYLEGYKSLHEKLYLSPNSTRKIEGSLERLSPGEPPEAMPVPVEPPPPGEPGRIPPAGRGPGAPHRGAPPPRESPSKAAASSVGSLSIRVQPGGAEILIDGERWEGPSGDERLIVQVSEGRHRIEIRKEGYEPFSAEKDVRPGVTESVNVSLARRP